MIFPSWHDYDLRNYVYQAARVGQFYVLKQNSKVTEPAMYRSKKTL